MIHETSLKAIGITEKKKWENLALHSKTEVEVSYPRRQGSCSCRRKRFDRKHRTKQKKPGEYTNFNIVI